MQGEFELIGLDKLRVDNDIIAKLRTNSNLVFRCLIDGDKTTKNKLFDYCKDNWQDKKIAIVEYYGYDSQGYPVNAKLLYIQEL